MHGMWIFPVVMPIIMLIALLVVLYAVLGRGGLRPPWHGPRGEYYDDQRKAETSLEILKKRYAKGEITREEFQQMKKDIIE